MNNQPNNFVLRCQQLKKTYMDGDLNVEVLRGVDFSLAQGDLAAIVGVSGSGKSTLLHLLGGLDKPSAGQVWVGEQALAAISEAKIDKLRNQTLGFVYQFHHLLAEFDALENVAMPLLIQGCTVEQAKQRASEILAKVQLSKRMQHRVAELSGGERQRVAIARALVNNPKCVLADEPTGNLDKDTAARVMELIFELNASLKTSFLIVTHDESILKKMHHAYYMQNGTLNTVNARRLGGCVKSKQTRMS